MSLCARLTCMNTKILRWGAIVALLILLFFWVVIFIEDRPIKIVQDNTPPVSDNNLVYQDPAGKFSLSYPKDFVFESSSTNSIFAKGVSFVVPELMATGTNLSKDSRIYVETKDLTNGTSTCENSTSSDAGAGNFYENTIYSVKASSSCISLDLFIHSTNIGNYTPGTIKEFDRAKLFAIFFSILQSLKIN